MKKSLLLVALLMAGTATFAQKLSPNTTMMLRNRTFAPEQCAQSVDGRTSAVSESVGAYVKIKSQSVISDIEALGGTVRTNPGGNLITADLPLSALQRISELDGVDYIEASKPVNICMDKAREEAGASKCRTATAGMEAYTGKGIVIGIVDGGIEYNHIDYLDRDGKESRIRRVWEQYRKGTTPAGFNYGVEYTSADQLKSLTTDTCETYHGGHVAGIAAGADIASGYSGVAPDADLVFVSIGENMTSVTDAVKYVFDYAQSVGKPCVVNLSLGSHYGPHDGLSAMDQTFDQLVGPGRIIVGAAGNEQAFHSHVTKTLSSDTDVMKVIINNPGSLKNGSIVNIWGSEGADLAGKFVLVNTRNGKVVAESKQFTLQDLVINGAMQTSLKFNLASCDIMVCGALNALNRKPEIAFKTYGTMSSTYKLGMLISSNEGAQIHAWQVAQGDSFVSSTFEGWTSPDDAYIVGEIGGTGKSVITVGSYNMRDSYLMLNGRTSVFQSWVGGVGELSGFSSNGPTADGRCKPDITAPGCGIVSAFSKYSQEFKAGECVSKRTVNGNDYYYGVESGTSMATPYVAGTIALWLQADPTLTVDDIRNIFAQTARQDATMGVLPNNAWGAGKIDSFEGLKYVLKHTQTGINEKNATGAMFQVSADRVSRIATVVFEEDGTPVSLTVFNAMGQTVSSQELMASGTQIDLSAFGSGVYVFKMQRGAIVKSVKMAL